MLFVSIRTFEKESLEINVVHNGCYFKLKEITFITLNNNTVGTRKQEVKKNIRFFFQTDFAATMNLDSFACC